MFENRSFWAVYFRVKLSENPSLQFIHRSGLSVPPLFNHRSWLRFGFRIEKSQQILIRPCPDALHPLESSQIRFFFFPLFCWKKRKCWTFERLQACPICLFRARWVTPGWLPITVLSLILSLELYPPPHASRRGWCAPWPSGWGLFLLTGAFDKKIWAIVMSSVSHPFPPPRKDKWRGGGGGETVGRNVYRADVCLEHAAPLMMNPGCARGGHLVLLSWDGKRLRRRRKHVSWLMKSTAFSLHLVPEQPERPDGSPGPKAQIWGSVRWSETDTLPQSKHSELKVQSRLCRHLLLPIHQQTSLIPSTHTYTQIYSNDL